jgi:hypothetical protein
MAIRFGGFAVTPRTHWTANSAPGSDIFGRCEARIGVTSRGTEAFFILADSARLTFVPTTRYLRAKPFLA